MVGVLRSEKEAGACGGRSIAKAEKAVGDPPVSWDVGGT